MIKPKLTYNDNSQVEINIFNLESFFFFIFTSDLTFANSMEFADLIKCILRYLFILLSILLWRDKLQFVLQISDEVQLEAELVFNLTMLEKNRKIGGVGVYRLHVLSMGQTSRYKGVLGIFFRQLLVTCIKIIRILVLYRLLFEDHIFFSLFVRHCLLSRYVHTGNKIFCG